ncbi:peptidase family M28 [Colletotrichum graminicola]|uniref:Peptide hydrolase n=1 Tax=Colletotrichum graminicola (strain M1.001 / M2 / FGSC 10212) TaxID=645133 RepID=E3QME0_COLGM|nr:peptidase family M28 [Colletotrichum graminicola M1.001]EFQ32028.1 peptidase family M28 [Colletotrichum graminicola M1.001]WDK17091.1 peptidase family M28 [Colletotrichum graminicola]
MRTVALTLALPALAGAFDVKPYVESDKLQALINIDDLLAGSQKLQSIADAHGGNRAFGGGGHNATVDWLVEELQKLDYYDIYKQPFTEEFVGSTAALNIKGVDVQSRPLVYTPAGNVSNAPLVAVANSGCDARDFPAAVAGGVALMPRGSCNLSTKATLAKSAGAAAAIVYNDEEGDLRGSFGEESDAHAPSVGITQAEGQAFLASLKAGQDVRVNLNLVSVVEKRTNYNVIAETRGGDHNNVLMIGGHADSVFAGPGINDDGSGTVGVLTVAKALSRFSTKNAVRLAFWGAEEYGKLGSYFYVKQLNSSASELLKIRAYLNFDMIASPNYRLSIYDGDGSTFNFSGPPGSDVIKKLYERFYEARGLSHVPSEFNGRSDYAAFIENGIPAGGVFTGAEALKTEAEAALFGGLAGVSYDPNYHQAGDDINNLNHDVYLINAQAIAHSVATYSMSWDTIPPVSLPQRMWAADTAMHLMHAAELTGHAHDGPCGGGVTVLI